MIPGKMIKGMGGAMDLVAGSRRVIVMMEHTPRTARRRSCASARCRSPASRCVHTIVTDLAVIDVTPLGLVLRERAPGVTADEIAKATGAHAVVERRRPRDPRLAHHFAGRSGRS